MAWSRWPKKADSVLWWADAVTSAAGPGRRRVAVARTHAPSHTKQWSLEVCSPKASALDWYVFESLRFSVQMQPDRVLMVGLYLPIATESDASSEETTDVESRSEGADMDDAQPPDGRSGPGHKQIAVPSNLGRYLLTASRLDRPFQTILLIGLDGVPRNE